MVYFLVIGIVLRFEPVLESIFVDLLDDCALKLDLTKYNNCIYLT